MVVVVADVAVVVVDVVADDPNRRTDIHVRQNITATPVGRASLPVTTSLRIP